MLRVRVIKANENIHFYSHKKLCLIFEQYIGKMGPNLLLIFADLATTATALPADLATTATALPETCQDGFELVEGGCYKCSETKKTFDEARAACQAIAEGYDLAIPNSPELVANLWKLTGQKGDWWIGLHDLDEEGNFQWVNGAPVTLTPGEDPWAKNEPNDWGRSGEDCAHYSNKHGGKWNDGSCNNKRNYICGPLPDEGCQDGLEIVKKFLKFISTNLSNLYSNML